MKQANFILLAMVAVSLLVAVLAWARGEKNAEIEQQIKTLQEQTREAYLKGDTSFLEKYYADDATIVHGNGKLSTKAQEIGNFKSGSHRYESLDVRDQKISIFGNTAVANLLVSVKGADNGKPFSRDVRNTRVWVKQKGNWQLVLFQTTRVAPASQ